MLLPARVLRPSRPVDLSAVGTSWGNIVDCHHISRRLRSLDSCNLLPVRFVVHRLTKGLDCNAELIEVGTPRVGLALRAVLGHIDNKFEALVLLNLVLTDHLGSGCGLHHHRCNGAVFA